MGESSSPCPAVALDPGLPREPRRWSARRCAAVAPEWATGYLEDIARSFGITSAEAARREAWRQLLEPLTVAVNGDREHFAELYRTDQGGPWRTVINYVGSLDAAKARVGHLVPDGAGIEWRQVSFSSADIDTMIAGRGFGLFRAHAEALHSIGHDIEASAMLVVTKGEQPDVEASFRDEFGPVVVFEEGPVQRTQILNAAAADATPAAPMSHGTGCSSRTDCPRWRGGVGLHRWGYTNATTNLWAKRWTGSSWAYYILFAGHAPYKSVAGTPYKWYHKSIEVGAITRNSYFEAAYWSGGVLNTNSDSSRVLVGNGNTTHTNLRNNWVYRGDTLKTHSLTFKLGSAGYAKGDPLCKSGVGYSPYLRCGPLDSKGHVVLDSRCCQDNEDVYVWLLSRADFNQDTSGWGLAPGDSGAVVYGGQDWNNPAGGTGWAGVAGPNTLGFFSLPGEVEADLQVTVCLNAECTN